MKKLSLCLMSFASLSLTSAAFSEEVPVTTATTETASVLTQEQTTAIEKLIGEYLNKNPKVVIASFQAAMEQEQKEALAKIEKAVAENKDKVLNNPSDPVLGNEKGTKSLVVFWDPNCGHCRNFAKEIALLPSKNSDVKIVVKDMAMMGDKSQVAVQAMLAAKSLGKYAQVQNAIFSSDKPLTKQMIMKMASSLGIKKKELEKAMNSKAVKDQMKDTIELAKTLGVNATPTMIVNGNEVVAGYLSVDELNKKLNGTTESTNKAS